MVYTSSKLLSKKLYLNEYDKFEKIFFYLTIS